MAKFSFVGKTPTGKLMKGIVSASSINEAHTKLKRMGISVAELDEKEQQPAFTMLGGTIKKKDIVLFTRQFSVMQDAGMGLVDTFEILSKQATNKALAAMIRSLKKFVVEGSNLAESLSRYPKHFNDLYVNMVRAGEMSGSLDVVLSRLANYLEKAMKLAAQVKTAMIYPTIVITAAVGIVWALLVWVVPIFKKVFSQSKGGLPLPTQILVQASDVVRDNFMLTIIMGIGLIILFNFYRKSQGGKYTTDFFFLKIPVLGNLLHKISISRFTTTLGTLISSGIPIVDGLTLAGAATGNAVISKAVKTATDDVVEGKPLAYSMEKTGLFPPMVCNMVRVGEETGALDTMLQKVNEFYEDEVDAAVKGLTSALEPILIIGLGSVIAGFVIALYLPIFQLATAMGG